MKLTRTVVTALGVLVLGALSMGINACGNNASGENSGAVGTLASTNGATDLSGTWVLNKDLSDHPRRPDSLHRPDSMGNPDGWRRRGGRGGHGPHSDSMGGGWPMRGPMTLVIEQTDSTVAITGPRGRTRTLYTDGRVVTHTRGDDGPEVQVTSSWNDQGQLVVVKTGPRGGTHTETFSLSDNGQQLFIDTHVVPPEREAFDFRRVFDAASSGG